MAEYIQLIFFSGDKMQEINVIQKGFKTPSTGFNSKNDYEKELYGEIDALLYPGMDKIVAKVAGLQLDFGNFSLCYKGTRSVDHAPATLSFHIAEFTFEDKKGVSRMLPSPPASCRLRLLRSKQMG